MGSQGAAGRPSLSVCTFTADPPAQVAASLALWRDVADEIVVAVDAAAAHDSSASLLDVADHVIRAEFVWPLEANLGWLHDQCRSDWILRIDGDEVPSAALVERLAGADWADDVTHLYLPRRWLWERPDQMLDQRPWWPDPQLRLTRRGLAQFPTGVHQVPAISGYSRMLAEPIYHLDLLLADEAARLAKARRYEHGQPGVRSDTGVNQNTGYYLPERWRTAVVTTAVPADDRAALRRVLDARRAPPIEGNDPTARTDRTAKVTTSPGATEPQPPPQPGDAVVDLVDSGSPTWIAGAAANLVVRVQNRTEQTWSPGEHPPLLVGARILDGDGNPVGPEFRAELPCPVRPGSAELVPMSIEPAPPVGTYTLEVGLLREWVGWFDSLARTEVHTEAQRRVLVSSGISPYRHLGDDLIVRSLLDAIAVHQLDVEPVVLTADTHSAHQRFGVRAELDASPLLTRGGVGTRNMLRALVALRRDARRLHDGVSLADPAHGPFLDLVASSQALVVAGAGWCTSRFRTTALLPRAAEVEVARVLGVPVLFEAGTVGPLTTNLDRFLARRILGSAVQVTVRDGAASVAQARRLGVARQRITEVPDAAARRAPVRTGVVDTWLRGEGIDPAQPWAVVCCRSQAPNDDASARERSLAHAVQALTERSISSVFVAHCVDEQVDDRQVGQRIASHSELHVPEEMPSDEVAVGLLGRAAMVLGDRFHAALVADAHGVPAVYLATTDFDRRRAGALSANVTVADTGATQALAEVVIDALDRGRGTPGAQWDGEAFVGRLPARAAAP